MTAIPDSLDALRVPVDSLKPYGRNPRRGDVKEIVRSLRHHGQYRPIVVNERTREVLAGNHTLEAAKALGWEEIAATFVDVDEDQAARIVLVDNRSNDLAGYDDEALTELLASLPDVEGTGYSPQDLTELLAAGGQTPGKDTEPKPRPKKPKARRGDLYLLGDHRLACGDATDPADLERLLGRESPELLVADPPYGTTLRTGSQARGRTDGKVVPNNDLSPEETRDLLARALGASQLLPGGHFYITVPDGPMLRWFLEGLGQGLGPHAHRQTLVWVKDRFTLGAGDYHPRHELILHGHEPQAEPLHEMILYGWDPSASRLNPLEDRKQDDVWEIPRPARSRAHPTMKPVELFERCVENSSRGGAIVYDPFAGSGTTALACENLNRRARLMELDPGYVDVMVDRWERHTGRAAERRRRKR